MNGGLLRCNIAVRNGSFASVSGWAARPRALAELRDRGLEGIGELISPGVHGWFWLPERLYDEIWVQRENRYDKCVVKLEFRPVEMDDDTWRWNTVKNNIVSITRASVSFECESKELTAGKSAREHELARLKRIERRDKWVFRGFLAALAAYAIYYHWWHSG